MRVLLVDDHQMFCQGLRSLLEREPDIDVVGEAGDGRTAMRLVQDLSPDVVIMDASMPEMNGAEATRQIKSRMPGVKVVALSMFEDKHYVFDMLSAGASAYVVKSGAYAELVRVPRNNLHALPDKVSFDDASLVQTLAVGYNGVKRRGEVQVQDRVLIFGCGSIGLCALAVAKASGAKVFMADMIDYRMEMARAMGAERVFNAAQEDFVKSVLEATQNKGVDKVIEAVGGSQDATLGQASQIVKRAGLIVVIGTFSLNKATLRMAEFKDRELDLRGSRNYVRAFPDCIDLIASGKVSLSRLITHRFPLAEVEKGLLLMKNKAENVMKVIIHP